MACFLAGTRILTDRGEVAVEDLREGDLVATRFGGLRPIRWIGVQRFAGRLAGPDHQPVRFTAGSLGGGLPRADLLVSPGHAMLVDEVLVHAGALVNDATILRERVAGEIAYYHLDLGPHDCVLAHGAWTESYFDDRNRTVFHNAAEFHARFPDEAPARQETCLPIVTAEDPRLPALHAKLAPKLPHEALTAEPDLHLLAHGRRVELRAVAEGIWQAEIPAGTRALRLRSRTIRPCMASDSADHRALGVMIWAIEIDGTAIDLAGLGAGWHAPEQANGQSWRWTDGDAALPLPALAAPARLILRGWHAPWLLAEAGAGMRIAA